MESANSGLQTWEQGLLLELVVFTVNKLNAGAPRLALLLLFAADPRGQTTPGEARLAEFNMYYCFG